MQNEVDPRQQRAEIYISKQHGEHNADNRHIHGGDIADAIAWKRQKSLCRTPTIF